MQRKLVFGLGALGASLLAGACTQEAARPDLPSTTMGNPKRVEVIGASGTTSASLTTGACEDVGSIEAKTVAAQLLETDLESASWTATDRPQPAHVTVLAAGDAATLVGRTVTLGTGENANYGTCTHCFVVAIGCGADCSKAAFFYPRAGTATFLAVGAGTFQGRLDNADFEQVTIDTSTDHSTPVPNGACMHITSLDFAATVVKGKPPAGSQNGTASSSGSSGASSSGGANGTGGSSSSGTTDPGHGGGGGGGHRAAAL